MILVIGGAFQGKLEYVRKTFKGGTGPVAEGESCTPEEVRQVSVVNHFHLLVKRLVEQGGDPHEAARKMLEINPDLIIISNELGCGVVPVTPFDRAYREAAGRVCCELAARAAEVHRVVCGLGQVIKAGGNP